MDSKPVQRIDLHNQMSQDRCHQMGAKMTKEGEGQVSIEGKVASGIRIHTRMSRLWWEADLVEEGMILMKMASNFIPVHLLLQPRAVGNPMVGEHLHSGSCF